MKKDKFISRDEIDTLQNKKVLDLVNYVYSNSAFYRRKMEHHNIEPCDIKDMDDFKKFPYTTKEEIIEHNLELLCVEPEKISRYHSSSGTTGYSFNAAYTKNDISVWTDCVSRSLVMANVQKGSVLQVAFNYGLWGIGFSSSRRKFGHYCYSHFNRKHLKANQLH